MSLTRREFLDRTALGGGALALMPGSLSAQTVNHFRFQPDAGWTVAGRKVDIDIALLGPNGEATSGFFASLDPFHGPAFGRGWQTVYKYLLKGDVRSTDAQDVENVITHITTHGIPREELMRVYELAKDAWEKHPKLRTNVGQSSDLNIPAGENDPKPS